MAPLTWREVSAPNFSGVSESQRLVGSLLNNGFQSAIDAIDGLQESQKASANGELLARIQSFSKPEDLRAALASGSVFDGLDRGSITADTLDRADAHARNLLGDTNLSTQTEGVRLDNQNQKLTNSQLSWSNDRARAYEAARPAAVDLVNQIRSAAAQGTEDGRRRAEELMLGGSGVFAAAGWTPEMINNQINGNLSTVSAGTGVNTDLRNQGDTLRVHGEDAAARDLFTSVLQANGNDVTLAAKSVRENPGIDPTVASKTLQLLGSNEAALLQGPAPDPVSYMIQQSIDRANGKLPPEDTTLDKINAVLPENYRTNKFDDAITTNNKLVSDTQTQAMFEGQKDLANKAASLMDAMTIDGTFGTSALAQTLLDPSLATENQSAGLARVRSSLGDGIDISDPELTSNINAVKDKYGMSFGQAASLLQNSVDQSTTDWIFQIIGGKANINFKELDKLVGQVYNKDGKTQGEKMQPAMQLLEHARSRQLAASEVSDIQARAQQAQQSYLRLLQLSRTRKTPEIRDALQAAQLQYQALLGQYKNTVEKIDRDPSLGIR